ncbi:hypothetical protein H4219_000119 [Mycoemilia scoparia]|uniref:Uncharacterized protein n=1 Tax=Mycoemilia scoparia TaxID=417184 RepID=A0A9W8DX33_9FUNG|nr:hypothetical protein H4219_000119 [Mycoemilia scoparia]
MTSVLAQLPQVGPITKAVSALAFTLSVLCMFLRFQSPNPEVPVDDGQGETYYNVYWDLARFFVLKPGLYKIQVNGLAAILAGFTVGFKQISPEYIIKIYQGKIKFRCSALPGLYLLIVPIVMSLSGRFSSVILLHFGVFEAWMYLRFFKYDGNVRGDLSETFAFSTFFPEPVRPPIQFVSNHVHKAAAFCRIVPSQEEYKRLRQLEGEEVGGSGYSMQNIST